MIWHERHGLWWMVQWWNPFYYGLSLGVHLDLRPKVNATTGEKYAPYLDFHLLFMILSAGVRPFYSSESGCHLGRGGERGYSNEDLDVR